MPAFAFAGPLGSDDELGVWQSLPEAGPRGFALESLVATAEMDDVSLWQVALPADRAAAARSLMQAQARLAVAEMAVPHASRRLRAFVAAGGPSPAIPPLIEEPETELASWAAFSQSTAGFDAGLPPFGPPHELAAVPAFQRAASQVAAFFDKVHEAVRGYAAIDTQLGGARIGVTLVSWTGDFRTAWPRGLALDDAQKHTAAVTLALRTRDAWLRLALTVVRGAAQLTALFSANPVLALPAAYHFVRQIIEQVQVLSGLPALT